MNLARAYALFVGIVLTIAGIGGFLSFLVTGNYTAAGAPSGSVVLLGIFAVNPLHNIIHLVTGLIALGALAYSGGAYLRWYALVFGVVYALVTVLGIVMGSNILGLIPINPLDDVLHAVLAIFGLAAYFMTSPSAAARTA
jgi:hypothetical protein